MKDNETKDRFIELRVQGIILAKIAAEIGVRDHIGELGAGVQRGDDILRAVEFEAL